ncbi:helix-turn-helix domain-containing protein [Streptomyces sp. T-3]|nr:helix-turn-helix domain-containing protein [Streptomyces sp. T-3]
MTASGPHVTPGAQELPARELRTWEVRTGESGTPGTEEPPAPEPPTGASPAPELRTELLPPRERFPTWREHLVRDQAPLEVRTSHASDFRATLRHLRLGAIEVAGVSCPPVKLFRTARAASLEDPAHYSLTLPLRGTVTMTSAGRAATLRPGDLVLKDAAQSFSMEGDADQDAEELVSAVVVTIPRPLLPLRPEQAGPLVSTRIPGDWAMTSLLSRYLQELIRHAGRYRAADTARLAGATTDLIASLLAHAVDTVDAPPVAAPEAHRDALQRRIHAYIQRHLGEPDLTPDSVAAAQRISLRYLHQLFQDQGLTVAAWIRRSRLERCRRELEDPAAFTTPIRAIAARWGLPDAAHFSRLFRSAYGISPSDYRHHHVAHAYPTTAHASSTTF